MQMTKHPIHQIAFSADMVRAIINGRKTQTRRTLNEHNTLLDGSTWAFHEKKIRDYNMENAFVDKGPSPAGNSGPYLHADYIGSDPMLFGVSSRIYPKIDIGDRMLVPSIFIPRPENRIVLKITDIRLQRINDISADDCVSEGIQQSYLVRSEFAELWDRIYAKIGFGWRKNPWVVAYTFEVE